MKSVADRNWNLQGTILNHSSCQRWTAMALAALLLSGLWPCKLANAQTQVNVDPVIETSDAPLRGERSGENSKTVARPQSAGPQPGEPSPPQSGANRQTPNDRQTGDSRGQGAAAAGATEGASGPSPKPAEASSEASKTLAPAPQLDPAGAAAPEDDREAKKLVQSYCVNVASAAQDARFLFQKTKLEELKRSVEQRTAELEKRSSEYQAWISRREEFINKAQDSLVGIYAGMKPEPAAQQLGELEEATAAAVLAKLEPKQSGAILADMDTKKAARLMTIIASSGKLPRKSETPDKLSDQNTALNDAAEAAAPGGPETVSK